MTSSAVNRRVSLRSSARWCAATIAGSIVIGGCASSQGPPPGGPPPANHVGPLPAACTNRITDVDQAREALRRVQPGGLVCLSGEGLTDAELKVSTSGTAQQPITVVGDGTTLRSVTVAGDYVVVQGLTLRDGDGLTMTGRGLLARDNVIYNATDDGLTCSDCVDTTLESNTVQRADGTGIWISGERITLRNNTVSESVMRTKGDADGIRFFGRGHRLTGNTIKDIKASGYPDGGPHADCFQTYNTPNAPPTYDVVIADNTCANVDVQALIATNDEAGLGAPAGVTAITFERNTVSVNGAQAVLLRHFPDVIVRDNRFSGPGQRAVMITEGSTDCAVLGNTVTGDGRSFEIDRSSEPGFRESGNASR